MRRDRMPRGWYKNNLRRGQLISKELHGKLSDLEVAELGYLQQKTCMVMNKMFVYRKGKVYHPPLDNSTKRKYEKMT